MLDLASIQRPEREDYTVRVGDPLLRIKGQKCAILCALEADIEQWTPAEDLALGRRCSVQSDGVEVAGVPIGTAAYVHSVARARVASHEAVHERVRLVLQCVQSAFVILRVSLAARMVYLARACGPVILDVKNTRGGSKNTKKHVFLALLQKKSFRV